jgi:hypothetical protein
MQSRSRRSLLGTMSWGLARRVVGYALAMVAFAFVPSDRIGWLILPVLIPLTFILAYKRLARADLRSSHYLLVAVAWLGLAVVLDYVLVVRAFNVSGYYDADVVIYYFVTFIAPLVVGWRAGAARQTVVDPHLPAS